MEPQRHTVVVVCVCPSFLIVSMLQLKSEKCNVSIKRLSLEFNWLYFLFNALFVSYGMVYSP